MGPGRRQATCAICWTVAVGGVAVLSVTIAGFAPWPAAIPGAIAAGLAAAAGCLSLRPAPRSSAISPHQALALGIPLPGERSTVHGDPLGRPMAGGQPIPSRRLETPVPAESPLRQAA